MTTRVKITELLEKIAEVKGKIKSIEELLKDPNLDKETRANYEKRQTTFEERLTIFEKRLSEYEEEERKERASASSSAPSGSSLSGQQNFETPSLLVNESWISNLLEKYSDKVVKKVKTVRTSTPSESSISGLSRSSGDSPPKAIVFEPNTQQTSALTNAYSQLINESDNSSSSSANQQSLTDAKKSELKTIGDDETDLRPLFADLTVSTDDQNSPQDNATRSPQDNATHSSAPSASNQNRSPILMALNSSDEARLNPNQFPSNLSADSALGGLVSNQILDMTNSSSASSNKEVKN